MRRLLFAVLLAALVAVPLLVGSHQPASMPPGIPATTATVAAPRTAPGPPPTGARPRVRRFIAAFLFYEIGADGPAVEAAIHTCASRHFARQLLSKPPTPPGRSAYDRARFASLRIDPVPGHPNLALASGDARRPGGVEPFSFLFARRAGRWLAVAPGE